MYILNGKQERCVLKLLTGQYAEHLPLQDKLCLEQLAQTLADKTEPENRLFNNYSGIKSK